jgi:hypothetical protein
LTEHFLEPWARRQVGVPIHAFQSVSLSGDMDPGRPPENNRLRHSSPEIVDKNTQLLYHEFEMCGFDFDSEENG